MENRVIDEDWEIIMSLLPDLWIEKASELGALLRKRNIKSAQVLLRVLLIHLAEGNSLRTTSTYAKQVKLCDINDTSLLHRLKVSGQWLRWMALELLRSRPGYLAPDPYTRKFRIRLVDGTAISEQGSKGTDWRIHYSLNLANLSCDTFKLTDVRKTESFSHFPVEIGDLLIGDRGYCSRRGMTHVLSSGGEVLVRYHSTNLPLKTRQGKSWPLLKHLRGLSYCDVGDWDVWFHGPDDGKLIKGRICAIKKSKEAAERAKKKIRQIASKSGRKTRPETLEFAEYIVLFTTVSRHYYKGIDLLNIYRARWQIELVFKRLKGIIGLGHLPKEDPESCKAWLYGKIVVSLLVENIWLKSEFFSPWGYIF